MKSKLWIVVLVFGAIGGVWFADIKSQEKHNEGDAYRTAKARAKATGKRFRIVDGNGNLVDLVSP